MKGLDFLATQTDFTAMSYVKMFIALGAAGIFGLSIMMLYRLYHRPNETYDLSISRSFPIITPAVTM
ncbi:MAG TPA: hypothetical protein VIG33_02620, partial [Pseudobdellovibrionaceae bacterium]